MMNKKVILNNLAQVSYVFIYEKFLEHGEDCHAIICHCYEMELFSMGRRGPDWQRKWYDFFLDTSCDKCREEMEKEEFWEDCNPRNNIESRIEKEKTEGRIKIMENKINLIKNKLKNKSAKIGKALTQDEFEIILLNKFTGKKND